MDIFISKLDADGNFVWIKQLGGTDNDDGKSIVVNSSGEIFITGDFSSTVDFDAGMGVFNLTSSGQLDIFISKLDASGNFIWAKKIGGGDTDYLTAMALDGSGNIYTTGYFRGTADFDPSTNSSFNLISEGGNDIFISKLDENGNFVWAKRFGSTASDVGYSIAIDESDNIYTLGFFIGTVDFDPGLGTFNLTSNGESDIFILKLDGSGNFIWSKKFGGAGFDFGYDLIIGESGNIHSIGTFKSTVVFDPNTSSFNLSSAGQSDAFILLMSQSSLGTDNLFDISHIHLYPNPVNNLLHIECSSYSEATISSANGTLLSVVELNNQTIDVSTYAPGIYFIRTAEGQTVKFIKE